MKTHLLSQSEETNGNIMKIQLNQQHCFKLQSIFPDWFRPYVFFSIASVEKKSDMPFPPSRSFPLTEASTGQGGGRVISDGWVLGVSRISKRLIPIKLWRGQPEWWTWIIFCQSVCLLPGWDADAEWKREVQDRFCVLAQLKYWVWQVRKWNDWCHGSWHDLSGSSLWSKESTEKRYEVELKKRGDAEACTHKGLSPERVSLRLMLSQN